MKEKVSWHISSLKYFTISPWLPYVKSRDIRIITFMRSDLVLISKIIFLNASKFSWRAIKVVQRADSAVNVLNYNYKHPVLNIHKLTYKRYWATCGVWGCARMTVSRYSGSVSPRRQSEASRRVSSASESWRCYVLYLTVCAPLVWYLSGKCLWHLCNCISYRTIIINV